MRKRTGGCNCGRVKFEVSGTPVRVGLCHLSAGLRSKAESDRRVPPHPFRKEIGNAQDRPFAAFAVDAENQDFRASRDI